MEGRPENMLVMVVKHDFLVGLFSSFTASAVVHDGLSLVGKLLFAVVTTAVTTYVAHVLRRRLERRGK